MSRFVRLFKPQFAALVESGEKRQTVRPVPKRMLKAGDIIDARMWTGKPYRSKQRKLAERLIGRVVPVFIGNNLELCIDGVEQDDFHRDAFAVADGFSCWEEMKQWFEHTHGLPFRGVAIFW